MMDNYAEWHFKGGRATIISKPVGDVWRYTIQIQGKSINKPDMDKLLEVLEDPEQELC